jgi:hypothetical protein
MADSTIKSYYSLYEQDMVALERSETDGKSAINPTIVTSLMIMIDKWFTDHDEPLFGPKTAQQYKSNDHSRHMDH